ALSQGAGVVEIGMRVLPESRGMRAVGSGGLTDRRRVAGIGLRAIANRCRVDQPARIETRCRICAYGCRAAVPAHRVVGPIKQARDGPGTDCGGGSSAANGKCLVA